MFDLVTGQGASRTLHSAGVKTGAEPGDPGPGAASTCPIWEAGQSRVPRCTQGASSDHQSLSSGSLEAPGSGPRQGGSGEGAVPPWKCPESGMDLLASETHNRGPCGHEHESKGRRAARGRGSISSPIWRGITHPARRRNLLSS